MSGARIRVLGSLATLWLVGGLVYPLLAVAAQNLSAMEVTAVRTTLAAAAIAPLLLRRVGETRRWLSDRRFLVPNVVAGLLFYPVGNGLLAYASSQLPSSLSALAFALLPVLAAVVTAVRGERLPLRVWLGIAVAMGGMVLVVGAPGAAVPALPVLAALASVGCWFIGMEFWSARREGLDLVTSIWLQLATGAVACWIGIAALGGTVPAVGLWFQPVMLLLALSQFIQHAAFLGIAGRVRPVTLTSFAFINPVVAAVAGYLLLGQQLTTTQLMASTVSLAAVTLVVQERDAG